MKFNENRHFYLLAYDISNNKRRGKIAKLLESLGLRVQGSVFEGWLTPIELKETVKKAKAFLNETEDSLRVYPLCADCREKVLILGQGERSDCPKLVVL